MPADWLSCIVSGQSEELSGKFNKHMHNNNPRCVYIHSPGTTFTENEYFSDLSWLFPDIFFHLLFDDTVGHHLQIMPTSGEARIRPTSTYNLRFGNCVWVVCWRISVHFRTCLVQFPDMSTLGQLRHFNRFLNRLINYWQFVYCILINNNILKFWRFRRRPIYLLKTFFLNEHAAGTNAWTLL